MYRMLLLLVAIGFTAAILPAEALENIELSATSYIPSAPRELLEAYLSFHDEEICRGVDSVFVSNENGMEILSRVEDEGRYKKLLKMFKPLLESGRMRLYRTASLPKEEESDEEDSLPPSLWENDELHSFLWPRLLRSNTAVNSGVPMLLIPPEEIFRQRLMIFSMQTLIHGRLVERFAADLPTLTRIVLNPAVEIDLRLLAKRVCREHSESLEKQMGKLQKNLKYALPKGESVGKSGQQAVPVPESGSPADLAALISENACSISRRVYSFMYPDCFTVELDELRRPDLLDSLGMLRELNDDFQKKMVEISVKF